MNAPPSQAPSNPRPSEALFLALGPAEQDLVLDLARASGSLKALAKRHGVSYPTIRARLDRLLARLDALEQGQTLDPMAVELADLVDQGMLSAAVAKHILARHRDLQRPNPHDASPA